jgi:hypothetical protein
MPEVSAVGPHIRKFTSLALVVAQMPLLDHLLRFALLIVEYVCACVELVLPVS